MLQVSLSVGVGFILVCYCGSPQSIASLLEGGQLYISI